MDSESTIAIMSVKTLIENAFGTSDANRVNFKLIETVLFIISRQLRILEQRVHIAFDSFLEKAPQTQLSVTEIKMHAKKKKKSRASAMINEDDIDRTSFIGKGRAGKKSGRSDDADHVSMISRKSVVSSKSAKSKKSRQGGEDEADTITAMGGHRKSIKSKKGLDDDDDEDIPQRSARKSVVKKSVSQYGEDTRKLTISKRESSDIDSPKSHKSGLVTDTPSRKAKDSDHQRGARKSASEQMLKDSMSQNEADARKLTVTKKDSFERDSSKAHKLDAIASGRKPKELENLEEQRERELRIISQRADSQEEADLNPQPMAGAPDIEIQQEKLLIVERVSSEDLGTNQAERSLQLSIVTLEQFEGLVKEVRDLEARFGEINVPGFPENEQLMRDLRKSASLTDAMGALQLSARLEASEKTLEKMISIVTELAKSSEGTEKKSKAGEEIGPDEARREGGGPGPGEPEIDQTKITRGELNKAMNDLYDHILAEMNNTSTQAKTNAEAALTTAKKLEEKLDSALELEDRMEDLDVLVADYTERITTMDTGVSSQMTAYQEQLTQMQYELEAGLDAMAESLANTGGDPAAVAELSGRLNFLQLDLENTSFSQKELKSMQNNFSVDLETLYKQMETINVTKCDRDEVTDALKDKAGLSDLNGRVKQDEFDAVRGDIEKRIQAAYNKFDSQELVWQKLIEELAREINQKVDYNQIIALREEINKYLSVLNDKYLNLAEIVGEPRAATVSRRLIRTGTCLSCSTPAQLNEETHPPGDGVEDRSIPNESGDQKSNKCCFGRPIPHPIDPRAFTCQRYCGGRHTVSTAGDRIAPGAIATAIGRPLTPGVGTDGKVYSVDKPELVACEPCNKPCSCQTSVIAEPDYVQCYEFTVNQQSFDDPSDLFFQRDIKILNKSSK